MVIPPVGPRAEDAAAALEVMSGFAADPRWLVCLPPAMSPTETTTEPGLLEHPREAFDCFQRGGIARVVCQQKHMGSRAVVIVCRDEAAAAKAFGITGDGAGIIRTRTGRRFFDDRATETELLGYVRSAIDRAGRRAAFSSDWFVLDCDLMPWSAKAQALLAEQYAAVGSASTAALADAAAVVAEAEPRHAVAGNNDLGPLMQRVLDRRVTAGRYVDAYRQHRSAVNTVSDLKLAPFHLLASEGNVAGSIPCRRWRSGSWRSGSKRWSGSSAASRCGGCTSASSPYWRWKASRSIRGCSRWGICTVFRSTS